MTDNGDAPDHQELFLKEYREEMGLTQTELALIIGKSHSYVSRVETDASNARVRDISLFARAVGTSAPCLYFKPGSEQSRLFHDTTFIFEKFTHDLMIAMKGASPEERETAILAITSLVKLLRDRIPASLIPKVTEQCESFIRFCSHLLQMNDAERV